MDSVNFGLVDFVGCVTMFVLAHTALAGKGSMDKKCSICGNSNSGLHLSWCWQALLLIGRLHKQGATKKGIIVAYRAIAKGAKVRKQRGWAD